MARKRCTEAEQLVRVQEFTRMLVQGARRSDCIAYGKETWGASTRACDEYLRKARQLIREDFDMERPQLTAEMLARYTAVEQEAWRRGELNNVLGALKGFREVAQIGT